jgi:flagellar motor switch protein FliG
MEEQKKKYYKIEFKDLLFFDNLALYYLIQETPLSVLARSFLIMDPKLAGSILGILTKKQREILHFAMAKENDHDELKNQQATESLVIIAQNLYEKGMIIKKGLFFYGKDKSSTNLNDKD